ncbi:YkgJ family cysteine cluster protein [Sulfurimonas sp.]|uniref:YkgJ family cysteine cluster protein n=1 Tax=Sulfurimonas sp. TaxID=2022749 RepID=UPI002AB22BCE|nr:YkgJ family cysteine cluster protein [Sulfurimonas sp.]
MQKKGFDYSFDVSACSDCEGRCCTGESGYIYVTKAEIQNISKLLNFKEEDFVKDYLYKKGYKYSIKEIKYDDSYECVFYNRDIKACSIYDERPSQCRTFPFWDYYKTRLDELKKECSGVKMKGDDVF